MDTETDATTTAHRLIANGTLNLIGPDELLERPSDQEIRERIAATPWPAAGARPALEHHRMGLIESRIQLDYLCAHDWYAPPFPSWAKSQGVTVEVHVKPRARVLRK